MEKYKCESCGAESPMCEQCHKKPSVTGENATEQICRGCMHELVKKGKDAGIDVLDLLYPMT